MHTLQCWQLACLLALQCGGAGRCWWDMFRSNFPSDLQMSPSVGWRLEIFQLIFFSPVDYFKMKYIYKQIGLPASVKKILVDIGLHRGCLSRAWPTQAFASCHRCYQLMWNPGNQQQPQLGLQPNAGHDFWELNFFIVNINEVMDDEGFYQGSVNVSETSHSECLPFNVNLA